MPKTKPWPPTKSARKLEIAYVGNFEPPHSTENHVLRALRHNGHAVGELQENDVDNWMMLAEETPKVDLILWTRTGWDWRAYGRDENGMRAEQLRMLLLAHKAKVPVVGYHLDIWWDLKRENQVYTEPFFLVDLLITADGGHEQRWLDAGVNHHWFPPGVSLAECELGTPRDEYRSPLAFVGSWDGGYHQEHAHRHELVRWLQQNYKRDCAFYPKPGEHAVRGKDLQDLYASVDVLIGDSCFSGMGLANYWSDRVPETLGRGGYLLHPRVSGMENHFTEGSHLHAWDAGDWDGLRLAIEWASAHPEETREVALAGREHTMKHHTYEVRVQQLVELLEERNML